VSFSPSSDEDEAEVDTRPVRSKRACRRAENHSIQPAVASTVSAKPAAPVTVKGKRTARVPPSRAETAHRPSESTVIASSRHAAKRTVQTTLDASLKRAAKAQDKSSPSDLPQHLVDLISLNDAFLKTITLHIAHEGDNAPVDFATLAPNLSRSWGKRQVTVEDIRRCIAVQCSSTGNGESDSSSPFIITDYGRGKVCIELDPDHRRPESGIAVDKRRLSKQFEQNLRRLCAARAADQMTDVDIPMDTLSLDELPQAAIADRNLRQHPMLSKGQRALAELKNGIAARQQDKDAKQQAAQAAPKLNQDGTKLSLLDRLRLKQQAREGAPSGPTGPELQRRAALNRVADVAATISMLSLANPLSLPRQAFAMPAIMERLKDSLRVPISVEEGTSCVRLIATEVAPEWLRIVTIGGRENVVVQRNCQPIDKVLKERVQKMLG
jgi:hypothetical protein